MKAACIRAVCGFTGALNILVPARTAPLLAGTFLRAAILDGLMVAALTNCLD